MNIGLDIMGGDFAPEEAIKGVVSFLNSYEKEEEIHFFLFGIESIALPYLHLLEKWKVHYTLVSCSTKIGMNEHPTKALKEKQDSSIAIGFSFLKDGKIDAFIGAGNTGAMLVGAIYSVKPIEGVLRPTIASPIPKLDGKFNFLLDVGANADCKAEHLAQFALMGSLYAEHILKIDNPRVSLLNLGEEEGKGNLLSMAAYPLLKKDSRINFTGNVEGRDILLDKTDVIVCEGFTGNVVLKMAESIHYILSTRKNYKDEFIEQLNYENYGGTPVLGLNAPVIIGHGISNEKAFKSLINGAIALISSNFIQILQDKFSQTEA